MTAHLLGEASFAGVAPALDACLAALPSERTCECATALKYAIITRPDAIPAAVRQELAPIVGKYMHS